MVGGGDEEGKGVGAELRQRVSNRRCGRAPLRHQLDAGPLRQLVEGRPRAGMIVDDEQDPADPFLALQGLDHPFDHRPAADRRERLGRDLRGPGDRIASPARTSQQQDGEARHHRGTAICFS